MNICVLSRGPELYSTMRIVEEGKKRGHDVEVVDPTLCFVHIASNKPRVHYKGRVIDHFDAVIPRIGVSVTFYATAVLRQFEMGGVFALNESVAITRSRDKLRALQIMARKGLEMPRTGFAHSTKLTKDLIEEVGGTPVVIKMLEGTQGQGVVLAENYQAAESVIELLRGLDAYFLVQEFVSEAKGSDLRCFVVGDKVIAAMKRQGRPGEFRSNLHRGGKAEAVKITKEERKVAVKAAQAMGLNVAGVDILRAKSGPSVIEVNSSPGLEGIETSTGINVAEHIYQFLERSVEEKRSNRTRGKG